VRRFALRYGFLEKPELIRFRVLDDRLSLLPGPIRPDIALDAESFAKLELPVRLVFVTENETNYLAFPPVNDAIVIFGAGYGWEALAKAQWLSTCQIHYWGDIDTHGFAILDSFRSRFPTARSFLMDYPTLKAHEALWGHEPEPVVRDLPRLTPAERLLYDGLRDNRYHPQVRLEQEKIEYSLVLRASEQAQRPANDPTQLR
jgi:hypothetical protein